MKYFIYIYTPLCKKKKNQKLKARRILYTVYCYMCTILISYVEKVRKNWLLDFFSNCESCDLFNYGSKISFKKYLSR